MNNRLAELDLKGTTLRLVLALAATAVLGGCASTISAINIPSNTAWRVFGTFIASPYNDLTTSPTGTNITTITSCSASPGGPGEPCDEFILCESSVGKYTAEGYGEPSTWNAAYQLSQCQSAPPAGATGISSLGVFYVYSVGAEITDAFTTGGIEVESAAAGPLFGIALTKSTTAGGPLAITAGASPVLLAGTWNAQSEEFLFNSSTLLMLPNEPNFGDAALCADGSVIGIDGSCPMNSIPSLICGRYSPIDLIAFANRSTSPSYSLTCGTVPISVNLNSSYTSLGACVDANIKRACTGRTGKARSACVKAQAGACQATFNVPSALNPNR